ncbi:hypothetical protein B0T21DRAFT_105929 [Apiosordaria backusii]|uniref:Uncharacterized protein n=1 Tax=Apiosordaria backusii TaxID=314023 RepID=A0AA40DIB0_9PEZI|nr:hypothetical protein B0T21DRAFT_105929 [Apiosordaria backusii]
MTPASPNFQTGLCRHMPHMEDLGDERAWATFLYGNGRLSAAQSSYRYAPEPQRGCDGLLNKEVQPLYHQETKLDKRRHSSHSNGNQAQEIMRTIGILPLFSFMIKARMPVGTCGESHWVIFSMR